MNEYYAGFRHIESHCQREFSRWTDDMSSGL